MMKILLLYGTTHGCSKKCAVKLAVQLEKLSHIQTVLVNAKGNSDIDISPYDGIIIGGSIRIGRMNKAISNFCARRLDDLVLKRIGLFISCMSRIDKAREYMSSSFPDRLRKSAAALGYLGGELNFDGMTSFEKSILKTVTDHDQSISLIDEKSIEEFAQKLVAVLTEQ